MLNSWLFRLAESRTDADQTQQKESFFARLRVSEISRVKEITFTVFKRQQKVFLIVLFYSEAVKNKERARECTHVLEWRKTQ